MSMKIILTQEVTGLGGPGDVVEVKDGYGRNYLLPRGAAVRWTRGGEKTVEALQRSRASKAVRDTEHADAIKAKLESGPVDVKVKAGAKGRLFGAVTTTEIAGALAEVAGEEVDRRTIALANPIKTLGSHSVSVRLHDDVSATVALNVIPA
jgi:large subunit ribosomal protein L9